MAQSGQFSQAKEANAAGTLTEISTYLKSWTPQRASDDTDLTTFATGGGAVTTKHVRGAAVSEFTVNGLFDKTYWNHIRQVVGLRSGVKFVAKTGNNNTPTYGDEAFAGTYLVPSIQLAYNTGAPATLNQELCPADGGTITPAFGVL